MSLPGSGYVCVLEDGDAEPHPDWTELPHLLESVAANFNGVNALGMAISANATAPIAGIASTDTTFQVAKKLAAIASHFHP